MSRVLSWGKQEPLLQEHLTTSSGIPATAAFGPADIPRLNLKEVNLKDPEPYKDVVVKPEVIPSADMSQLFSFRTLIPYLGPCALMSVGFLDPGNIEADLQTGAFTGYSLLWMHIPAHLFSLGLHLLGAHLTVGGGHNLAETCRREYSQRMCIVLWIMSEITIIVSDVQAVVGSAMGLRALTRLPLWQGALLSSCDTFLLLLLHLLGVRKLEALLIVFMLLMFLCCFITFAVAEPNFSQLSLGMLPSVPSDGLYQVVAIYSATIVPAANIFFFSSLVQTRKVDRNSPGGVAQARKYFFIGAALMMFVAFLVNVALTVVGAQFFYSPTCAAQYLGFLPPSQCVEIGLDTATDNLPLSANLRYIWAVGLIVCGQWSTMTETWTGQLIMEGFFRWKVSPIFRILITRTLSLAPATVICLFLTDTRGRIDNWLNVVQALMLAFVVYALLDFTSSRRIMGTSAIGPVVRMLTWAVLLVTSAANFGLILTDFILDQDEPVWVTWVVYTIATLYGTVLVILIGRDVRTLYVTRCGHGRTVSCSSATFINSRSDEVERVGGFMLSDEDEDEDSLSIEHEELSSRTLSGPTASRSQKQLDFGPT